MDYYLKDIGQIMQTYRKLKNVPKKKVADMLGISVQQYQRYEAGRTSLTVERLIKISLLLQIPVDTFFSPVKTRDLITETSLSIIKRKDLLNTIDANPELHELIKNYDKNPKDGEIPKLIRKIHDLPVNRQKRLLYILNDIAGMIPAQ